jgi:inner membrane protein
MSEAPLSGPEVAPASPQHATDWGGKALLVCLLAFLMGVPGLLVFALVQDRAHRAHSVTQQVSELRGGAQRLLGPMIAAPYVTVDDQGRTRGGGWWLVSPQTGTVAIAVKSASLHRGIFDVPVYDATADIRATFGPLQKTGPPPGVRVDWDQARVMIGFTDLRGAKSDITGNFTGAVGKSALEFTPASFINLASPVDPDVDQNTAGSGSFGLVASPASAVTASPAGGIFMAQVRFTGAQRLGVMPFAKATKVTVVGDWPSPSFDGGFLPERRQVESHRFTADWVVPFVARGLSDQGASNTLSLAELAKRDVGVTFARANNPYENVGRSLKYGIMFVGLVFLTFFVFEALSGRRLHPAQYLLIGLAQMVFYLLLLSLSEYVGFDIGFAAAGVATVGLIGLYAGWAFRSGRYRARALVIFSILYALIYCLMRLEDFALLAGALASFIGLSAAMYLTRNLEWYGGRSAQLGRATPASGPPANPGP